MSAPGIDTAAQRAPSVIQLGRRLVVFVSAVLLLAVAVWLWLSWQHVREGQLASMTTTVRLVAAHADHYFASIGNKMEVLARDLAEVNVERRPEEALALLKAFKAAQPDVLGVGLIRPDGQIFVATEARGTPGPLPNVYNNPLARADFERAIRTTGLSISRPHPAFITRLWVIFIRYAVRDRRNQVRYLIQAGVPLERQQALWHNLSLTRDAALGLLRADGYFVSRIPESPSAELYQRRNLDQTLYQAMRTQPQAGSYEGWAADGSYRIGVYQRLAQQPMYAFLSHKRGSFMAAWWQQVRAPLAIALGFLLASVIGYWRIAARYSGRLHAVETSLSQSGATAVMDLPSTGMREIDTLVAALTASREKLRQAASNREKLLLAAAEAGTYVVRERDGAVTAADDVLLDMLGRTADQVLNHPWDELVSQQADEALNGDTEGMARRILRVNVPPGAKPRWMAVAEYRDTSPEGEPARFGLAIDVSDREYLLSHVNRQSLRLQALWQLATTRDKSSAEKMQLILRLALDTLHMEVALVNELQGERLTVRLVADDLHIFRAGQAFVLEDAVCRLVVANRETYVAQDLATDPALRAHPMVTENGLHGFASVPIWAGRQLYGTMGLLRRAPLDESFGADDRAFIELVAAWFGQILLEQRQRTALESLAMSDWLTRLINRRGAEARFAEEFARAERTHEVFSIAICDLDRFKLINDHYGHDTGDRVLLHIAELLKGALREGDWVARWGGEEFIIFLHHSDASAAHTAMDRLRLAIKSSPVSSPHGPLTITTSIGIGTYRGTGEFAAVLSEADGCLYEAKRAGRDRVVATEPSRRGTLWRAGMLQHALAENRIVPAYQAIVDLASHKPVADEALARLIEPDGRVVPAGEFVDAAEGINLIHVVDEVVSRQSMQRCASNLASGKEHRGFAHFINLSPQFLAHRELVQAMLHQAARHCQECDLVAEPVKPVVLEITERQLLGNFDDLLHDLRPLLDFGFRLALDDFGSGYSSFLYLAKLPVSFLKIEGWMVRNMRGDAKVLAMVQSIIHLARQQGITTIAECVEDAETAAQLRDLGADWAQGWYFGRPECDVDLARTGNGPARNAAY